MQSWMKAAAIKLIGPTNARRIKARLGRLEFDEVDLVHDVFRRLKHRGVMIDVGAHHGYEASKFLQLGWTVIAFEPDRRNRATLLHRLGSNPRLVIDPRVLSDQPDTDLDFYASDVSTGISGLHAFHPSHTKIDTVDATSVALVMEERGLAKVDFLKIDTEGHDLFVLKGVDWSSPPDVITCEFEDRKTKPLGYSVIEIHAYLVDRGYEVTISEWEPIVEYGQQHRWKRFTADPMTVASDAWGNLVAFRTTQFAELSAATIATLAQKIFPKH